MGLFDFLSRLFGGGSSSGYSRIAGWVKHNYGSGFRNGMNNGEVRLQLETIAGKELGKGVPEKTLRGFRAYIERQDYDGLVTVSGSEGGVYR